MTIRVHIAVRHLAPLALVSLSSCFFITTQRWPKPMEGPVGDALPPDPHPHLPGPEEATVLRIADPVQFRPAGALSGFPVEFYDKKLRATAGACVIVSAGGRAETLWPSGTSIVLFGQGVGWIGSTSRGEPLFELQDVDRAMLMLKPGDSVRLLGGAMLHGDNGPYRIERVRPDVLRVRNQSKQKCTLAFRDAVFELAAGQQVNLPLVSTGTGPIAEPPDERKLSGAGYDVLVAGKVNAVDDAGTVHLAADGPVDLQGLGVRVHLESGESASFKSLGSPSSNATNGIDVGKTSPATGKPENDLPR